MRASFVGVIVTVFMTSLLAMTPSAKAAPTISVQGYDTGGGFTFADGSSPIPVGATLEIRVWVDLDSCDPISVNWGDGSPTVQKNYGGSLAQTWEHKYTKEGTFAIVATESLCPGTSSGGKQITVGGIGFPLDPSSPFFMPTMVAIIFAVIALALANAKVNPPRPRPSAQSQTPPAPAPRPRLKYSGIPANMTHHLVRLQEVPPGAPMQYDPLNPPKIPMEFGKPTNIDQHVACHACGTQLGFTVEGWFCMNPRCPLIGTGQQGFPRNPL